MKKKLSILATTLLVCCNLFAYDFEVDGYYYSIKNINELTVSIDKGENSIYSGTIDIPNTVLFNGKEFKVIEIKDYVFKNCSDITNIIFGNNLKWIGEGAFYGTSITFLSIPANIKAIDLYAFQNCPLLKKVIFEDGEDYIVLGYNSDFRGNDCFDALEEIYFGRSWYQYSTPSFNMEKMRKFTIGKYMTSIPDGFFKNAKIEELTIPSNIKSLGSYALGNCNNLKKVFIQDGTSILNFGPGYGSNGSPFGGCPVEEAYLGRETLRFSSYSTYLSGVGLFDYCPLNKITIGSYVSKLCKFSNCQNLTEETIPSNITEIGGFEGCDNLMKVTCYSIEPPTINTYGDGFSNKTFLYGQLQVLEGCSTSYKNANKWKNFFNITEISGSEPQKEQCSLPSITYKNKKLVFDCDTQSSTCHSSITCDDVKSSDESEIELNAIYRISVYATADGYRDSEVATAKLYWVDGTLADPSSINSVQSRGVLVRSNNGIIDISGLEEDELVSFYSIDGKIIGKSKVVGDSVHFSTFEKIIIAKIGNSSIKISTN